MSHYGFIDTVSQNPPAPGLPAEAVKINGVYIENLIGGYRTLYTLGREGLAVNIVETDDNPHRDGSIIDARSFPSRVITVGFQLITTGDNDFRSACNSLNRILNVVDAELIFADEPDKYFIGSPVLDLSVEPGTNKITGEWNIICPDPFKYATSETQFSAENDIVTIENDGGYKAYPRFEITFATDESQAGDVGTDADCGYVQIQKYGTDAFLQFGDDEEKDTQTSILCDYNLKKKKGDFADVTTISPPKASYVFNGTSKILNGLVINSSASVSKKFHGALAVYTLPSAMTSDFNIEWKHVLCSGANNKAQTGAFYVMMFDASDNLVYMTGAEKSNTTKLSGTGRNVIEETEEAYTVDLSHSGNSGYKGTAARESKCYISRTVDSDSATIKINNNWYVGEAFGCPLTGIKKVAFFIANYGSKSPLENRVTWVKITDGDRDVINTFASGDILSVDTDDMRVLLNNENAANLGDIANTWDDMACQVGDVPYALQYSDWVEEGYEPTIKAYIRKRWL